MPQPDACCGMGGSFNLKYYEISSEIGKLKRDNIKASGCEVVATGCPACMLQISDVLSRSKDRLTIKHPIEIYAEGLNR
jgi:glycolate oxidase iron-sulfur subunit